VTEGSAAVGQSDVFDVAVVGGGLSGLAALRELERRNSEGRFLLIEREAKVGGLLRTHREGDFLIDEGADSWVTQKPMATQLCRELGLEAELMTGLTSGFSTLRSSASGPEQLVPMPPGLVYGVPTRARAFLQSPLVSFWGKMRIALDMVLPKGIAASQGEQDEAIGQFIQRRLGREAKEVLVGPLLAGIYSGDIDALSTQATFPNLLAAERDHRSLILALRKMARTGAQKRSNGAQSQSPFTTLRSGVAALPQAMLASLRRTTVMLSARACGIAFGSVQNASSGASVTSAAANGFTIDVRAAGTLTTIRCKRLVLATRVPELLAMLDDRVGDDLRASFSRYKSESAATVFFAWPLKQVRHALHGTGFIVPPQARAVTTIAACTYVSQKWASRAPEGTLLLRAFFGHKELCDLAERDLARILQIDGRPMLTRLCRFPRASSQPLVGHLGQVAATKEKLRATYPGLFVVGGGFDATGISDCLTAGTKVGAECAA
jgi:protoporphyrinogen/coproporphyrinogen III oxidase